MLKIDGVVTATFMKNVISYRSSAGVVVLYPHAFTFRLDPLNFHLCDDDVDYILSHELTFKPIISNYYLLSSANAGPRRDHALLGQSLLSTCASLQVETHLLVMLADVYREPDTDIRALHDAYTSHMPELPAELHDADFIDSDSDRAVGEMYI